MNKSWIFAIVLGVLIIVAAVQAVQLYGVKTSLEDGSVSVGSASAGTNVASGSNSETTSSSSSLAELPSMVGGC